MLSNCAEKMIPAILVSEISEVVEGHLISEFVTRFTFSGLNINLTKMAEVTTISFLEKIILFSSTSSQSSTS